VNIYICSTVRHLLFSLCRANHENQQQHHILFYADYQQASLSDWDFTHLPSNIHIYELSRREFRKQLKATRFGRLSYFFAMRQFPAPYWLHQPVSSTLKKLTPQLAQSMEAVPEFRLWLFNERNKMARVFRLLAPKFSDIEEGEGNYHEWSIPWWKAPARIMRGLPPGYRVFGDDPNCEEVWAIDPERLPPSIEGKSRQIDFLHGQDSLDLIAKIFGETGLATETNDAVILATQPLEKVPGVELEDKQQIYAQIVTYLQNQGREVILKIHPVENSVDYVFLADRTISTHGKLPIEAIVLGSKKPILIVSVCSTAGLGFEKFCNRITLCRAQEYRKAMPLWAKKPEALAVALDKNMS
jgi:hypothetical protein